MARRSEAELLAFHEEQAKKIRERLEHRKRKVTDKTYARCTRIVRDLEWLESILGDNEAKRTVKEAIEVAQDALKGEELFA